MNHGTKLTSLDFVDLIIILSWNAQMIGKKKVLRLFLALLANMKITFEGNYGILRPLE